MGDRVQVKDGALAGERGTVRSVGWLAYNVEVEFDNVSVPVWLRSKRLCEDGAPRREA